MSAKLNTAASITTLVVVSALLQLLLIWTPRADLRLAGPGQVPQTFHPEEISSGTLALDLLEGPVLGVLDYQHAPYFGGSVVMGVVAAPFFALFGPTVFSLKLGALLIKALGVVFLFLILDRWAGRRAAWIGTLCFAIAAPGYARLSIIAWGTHFESNTFGLAILWFFGLAYADHSSTRARLWALFAAGLIAGFATYFCFIILILIGTLALLRIALRGTSQLLLESLTILCGYALGLTPWLIYSLRHDWPARAALQHALGDGQAPQTLGDRAQRVLDLSEHYPRSFYFVDLPARLAPLAEYAFAVTFALAFLGTAYLAFGALRRPDAARPRRIPIALCCASFPLIFVLGYALNSGFQIGQVDGKASSYRYLFVLYPLACLAAGMGAARLYESGRPLVRSGLNAWTAGLCALAFVGQMQLLDPAQAGINTRIDGYSRHSFGRFLAGTYARDPELVLSALERSRALRSPQQLDLLYRGLSSFLLGVTLAQPELLDGRLAAERPYYEQLLARLRETSPPEFASYFHPAHARQRARRHSVDTERGE